MYGLMAAQGTDIVEQNDVDATWRMGTGTALHTQFQTHYLPTLGKVYQGWWRCNECRRWHRGEELSVHSRLSHGWIPRPDKCSCGHEEFESVELEFRDEEHRITGHCDGILDWNHADVDPEDEIEVLELKSIAPMGYRYVDPTEGCGPKPDHIKQTQGYLWGLEGTAVRRGRIMYICKDFEKALPQILGEHLVYRDQGAVSAMKADLRRSVDVVGDVEEWRAAGCEGDAPIPDRLTACRIKSDKRTRFCPMRDQCFPKKKKAAKKSPKALKVVTEGTSSVPVKAKRVRSPAKPKKQQSKTGADVKAEVRRKE